MLEPREGGRFETEGDHGNIHYVFGGKVVRYRPPRELTVEWGWMPPRWPDVTLLSFLLEPEDGGGTRVEIVHHGFERLGQREVYESFEDGWDLSELDGLKRAVEDR